MEEITFTVPAGMGYLIGNTLRQFAMKGGYSLQIAAYKLGKNGFGINAESPFSYLDLLQAKFICTDKGKHPYSQLCDFVLEGDTYVCGDMKITGIAGCGLPKLTVYLVYASSSRTAEENYDTLVSEGNNADDYICVPSRHVAVSRFRFKVEPKTRDTEALYIEASDGAVKGAIENVMKVFKALI